jgi:hypothetical protein
MSALDQLDREGIARHEAAHVLLARDGGVRPHGVWFSEKGGAVHWKDDISEAPENTTLRVALAGYIGGLVHEDRAWRGYKTLATWFTESSNHDAKLVRLALNGRGLTRTEAIEHLAGEIEDVANSLRRRGQEWTQETELILNGARTPRAPSGYAKDARSKRPVYFSEGPQREPARGEVVDCDPFVPEPETGPRLVRDAVGRLVRRRRD